MQRVRADYEIWTQQTIVQAIKKLRQSVGSEHYKGYFEKASVFETLQGEYGNYAYCVETGTLWLCTADGVWINTTIFTPVQQTPKSLIIPFQDEEQGSIGNSFAYSAGDHVHPISSFVKGKLDELYEIKLNKTEIPNRLPNPEYLSITVMGSTIEHITRS
ncbi:MAG: hypothetical protein EZS28_053287 [Streblomastix strix]|uniref:Uncharacterized protein n=1 Tax=Streblomastix strix TaxID=222440 RepID=A0A5J4RHP9_9EUKA|nr:MAG: hypothetical protein EZS28_053287 [Streblomastix strix]